MWGPLTGPRAQALCPGLLPQLAHHEGDHGSADRIASAGALQPTDVVVRFGRSAGGPVDLGRLGQQGAGVAVAAVPEAGAVMVAGQVEVLSVTETLVETNLAE